MPDLLAAFGQHVFLLLLNFTPVFRLLSYCSQNTELKRLRVFTYVEQLESVFPCVRVRVCFGKLALEHEEVGQSE